MPTLVKVITGVIEQKNRAPATSARTVHVFQTVAPAFTQNGDVRMSSCQSTSCLLVIEAAGAHLLQRVVVRFSASNQRTCFFRLALQENFYAFLRLFTPLVGVVLFVTVRKAL